VGKILFVGMLTTLTSSSCFEDSSKQRYPPPLPPPDINLCEKLRANTYERLAGGRLELRYNDTFSKASKSLLFREIIRKNYDLYLAGEFLEDSINKNCINAIMDSALESRFGPGSKLRIIDEACRHTISEYNKGRRVKTKPGIDLKDL